MRFINLNCITKSCNWYTYVTWQGNECKLSEDDMTVETCRSVIIYKLIVIVLLLVILQNNKNAQYMYQNIKNKIVPTFVWKAGNYKSLSPVYLL